MLSSICILKWILCWYTFRRNGDLIADKLHYLEKKNKVGVVVVAEWASQMESEKIVVNVSWLCRTCDLTWWHQCMPTWRGMYAREEHAKPGERFAVRSRRRRRRAAPSQFIGLCCRHSFTGTVLPHYHNAPRWGILPRHAKLKWGTLPAKNWLP